MRIDQLYAVNHKEVASVAMALLSVAQRFSPQTLVMGLAWMFLAICDHYDVEPRRALEIAERVKRAAFENDSVIPRAIMRFCREELPR